MAKATAPNVEHLMNDYFAARHGDESKLYVLSDTFTFRHPFGEVHRPDELVAMQRENMNAIPDIKFEVGDMVAHDDVVMWEWTMTGTHENEWQGIPATGRTVKVDGMSKTVIGDGKVQENRAYFDSQDLLIQLGVGDESELDA